MPRADSSPSSVTPSRAVGHPGQELGRHVPVHDERLGGVAHAGPLCLGVHHDRLGHVEIGGRVHVDVAVADPVDHERHGRMLLDRGDRATHHPGG